MVFAVLFKQADLERVRITVNPLAGPFGAPAWDFFWIIRDPSPGVTWELPLRVLWKPFLGRQDILEEYESYNES